jgi:hypothetical protein
MRQAKINITKGEQNSQKHPIEPLDYFKRSCEKKIEKQKTQLTSQLPAASCLTGGWVWAHLLGMAKGRNG